MNVRAATPQDMDELLRLYEERMDVYLQYESRQPHYVENQAAWQTAILEWIEQDNANVLVVQRDDQLIGYMIAWVWKNPPFTYPATIGMVTELSVDGHCKQGGVGTALLESVSTWFREKGLESFEIRVPRRQAIEQAFWRAVGAEAYHDHMYFQLR